jgi:hypothetical protein
VINSVVRQIPLSKAPPGLCQVIGYTRLTPNQISDRTGLIFEQSSGDLGPMDALAGLSCRNMPFGLYRLRNAPIRDHTTIVVSDKTTNITQALEDILESLGILTNELRSMHSLFQFHSCKLWRQDDNGHATVVETFNSRSDASIAARHYSEQGHKQHYWVEPCDK